MSATAVSIRISDPPHQISALLNKPAHPNALLVLAHGAGAGMTHPFMELLAAALLGRHVATLRYQFPYMEMGKKRPDSAPVAKRTVKAAIEKGRALAGEVPLLAGGKSFGARMTSQWAAEEVLEDLRGLVFYGWPLHPAGKPGQERASHLLHVPIPMLFLQGTRDRLAEVERIRKVCDGLDLATLRFVEDGDHSFRVLKRTGKSWEEVIDYLAEATHAWIQGAL